MKNFNYINTLKQKRNEQLGYNKNNIKKKLFGREDSIPSYLDARQVRYALRYHAYMYMVCGVNSLMNRCLNMNWLHHCYSYLNGLADLWCLRGRCLPIVCNILVYYAFTF